MRPFTLMLCLSSACTPEVQLGSSDQRIDGIPEDAASDPDSSGARLCVAGDHVYVAWQDDREGDLAVWFTRSTNGGQSWSEVLRVDSGDAQASVPAIACEGDTVHVVWEDTRDGDLENHNLYYQRSDDAGDTWLTDDLLLSEDVEGEFMSLGAQIVARGDAVYVTWFDSLNGAFDIYVSASLDRGATWGLPVRVDGGSPGAAYSAWPQIEADAAGHVYVTWEDARHGGSDIYAAASDQSGATFWDAVRLDGPDDVGAHDSFTPQIAADDGNVYVVWHDTRGGEARDIYMNWSNSHGRNWATSATRVDSDQQGFYDSLSADVAVLGDKAHVVWQDARAGAYDVFLREADLGVFQTPEERIDVDTPGAANSLEAQVLREGNTVVVLWQDRRSDNQGLGYNDLYYRFSLDGGDLWSETDLRIDSLRPGTSYKVDVDATLVDGRLYAVWEDGRRGSSDIYFQALEVGEEAPFVAQ